MKTHAAVIRYSSILCSKPFDIFDICDIIMSISARGRLNFWIYSLNCQLPHQLIDIFISKTFRKNLVWGMSPKSSPKFTNLAHWSKIIYNEFVILYTFEGVNWGYKKPKKWKLSTENWLYFPAFTTATLKEEKVAEENVTPVNCHDRNLETFATFSSGDNLFSDLLQYLISAVFNLTEKKNYFMFSYVWQRSFLHSPSATFLLFVNFPELR